MLKLFISKSKDLDEKEIVVLAALNGLYSSKQEYLTVSIIGIAYNLTKRWIDARNRDRRLYENIKAGIKSLADRKIITILDQSGDNYIISKEGLEIDTDKEKFVAVEMWEMQKIFPESNKPFNVFVFLVNLIGTINNQTKEWHMPQDDMAALWGASKRTVNDYLGQLENMQLIFIYRHKKRRAGAERAIPLTEFDTPEEAFVEYKMMKQADILRVVAEYKNRIPDHIYRKLLEVEVQPY